MVARTRESGPRSAFAAPRSAVRKAGGGAGAPAPSLSHTPLFQVMFDPPEHADARAGAAWAAHRAGAGSAPGRRPPRGPFRADADPDRGFGTDLSVAGSAEFSRRPVRRRRPSSPLDRSARDPAGRRGLDSTRERNGLDPAPDERGARGAPAPHGVERHRGRPYAAGAQVLHRAGRGPGGPPRRRSRWIAKTAASA